MASRLPWKLSPATSGAYHLLRSSGSQVGWTNWRSKIRSSMMISLQPSGMAAATAPTRVLRKSSTVIWGSVLRSTSGSARAGSPEPRTITRVPSMKISVRKTKSGPRTLSAAPVVRSFMLEAGMYPVLASIATSGAVTPTSRT